MTDLWRLSAAELAALVKSKKVSAKEAAAANLARLDAVNPKLNAVIDHRPEEVLKQAAEVDAKIARGEEVGPLGGVPVTVKVNIDQEGFANTNGLKQQRDVIAKSNSPVVDNLRKAGALILGRTNTPAFSYRWFTSNLIHGDTKNPRDPSLTPGGSSGGAGSAVLELLAAEGCSLPLLQLGIPDRFIAHGSREGCLAAAGLDAAGLRASIEGWWALQSRERMRSAGGA